MAKVSKEDGFTLIEMLLVLAVIGILATATMHFAVKKDENLQNDPFFRQFQMDLHSLQSHAMANQISTRLQFTFNGTEYVGSDNYGSVILRRKMPDGYRFKIDNKYRIVYLRNGNVQGFGTLSFNTPNGDKSLNVHVGNGRMQLVE